MECVAYMRVSTDKQAEEGNGLDSQKRDIIAYCRKNEMIVTDWYIDDGFTGSNMHRPELQRLVNDCSKKRVKCVIAFKLDRLSRSMVDGIYIIERIFLANSVKFMCVHDSVSYDSPMEQAYTQMMAVFAQLEKNTMLLRMRGGMLERVKKGFWMGGGVTPYCYEYSKELGILIAIPEREQQVREAMQLYLEGYSEARIKNILCFKNESTLRNVLTSETNAGWIRYKGNLYKGLHRPIFSKKEFELLKEVRKARASSKVYKKPNLLTGLCYCGVCGCKMRYQKWGSDEKKIVCYSSQKNHVYIPNYNPNCNNSREWAKGIENQVEEEIVKISLDLSKHTPKAKETKVEIMQQQLEKEKSKLKRLYVLYADGNDTVLEMIRELESNISDMKEKLKAEMKNPENTQKKQFVYENIKKIADIWNDIDQEKKNLILKSIVSKIIIVNGNIEIQLKNF